MQRASGYSETKKEMAKLAFMHARQSAHREKFVSKLAKRVPSVTKKDIGGCHAVVGFTAIEKSASYGLSGGRTIRACNAHVNCLSNSWATDFAVDALQTTNAFAGWASPMCDARTPACRG